MFPAAAAAFFSLAAAMEGFTQWAGSAERSLVAYFHPGFDYDARVTKGWPMTQLDSALYALAAYGVLVLVGLILRASSSPATGKAAVDKAKKEPTVAESFSAGTLSIPLSRQTEPRLVNTSCFIAEPIKYVMLIYNAVQVSLCGGFGDHGNGKSSLLSSFRR